MAKRRSILRRVTAATAVLAAASATALAASSPASADGTWCSQATCLKTEDAGVYIGTLEVSVETWGGPFDTGDYHVHVWGPGFDQNTKTETITGWHTYRDYIQLNRVFNVGDVICAEGWRKTNSGYQSGGLPCFTITRS